MDTPPLSPRMYAALQAVRDTAVFRSTISRCHYVGTDGLTLDWDLTLRVTHLIKMGYAVHSKSLFAPVRLTPGGREALARTKAHLSRTFDNGVTVWTLDDDLSVRVDVLGRRALTEVVRKDQRVVVSSADDLEALCHVLAEALEVARRLEAENAEVAPSSAELERTRPASSTEVSEPPAYSVFGPQGEQVAALIERVRRLTAEEIARLNAVGYSRRYNTVKADALNSARSVTLNSARSAARVAAEDAARVAAGGAAVGVTVLEAVGALVLRDVLPYRHYRTLTAPWSIVVGRAHPDDTGVA